MNPILNTGIRGSHMIYSNHRSGSVRHVRDKKQGEPAPAEKRSGKETHEASEKVGRHTGRYYGTARHERIVSKDGKLAIVSD